MSENESDTAHDFLYNESGQNENPEKISTIEENINNITQGGPLKDDVMNGVLQCFENSFPHIGGFQKVELGRDLNFAPINGMPWIQVITFKFISFKSKTVFFLDYSYRK